MRRTWTPGAESTPNPHATLHPVVSSSDEVVHMKRTSRGGQLYTGGVIENLHAAARGSSIASAQKRFEIVCKSSG